MNLFKEVADIKTADQLHLPTPEVEYHNIVAQPTEQQQEMVKALSERASLVHSGTVDPSQDNMLKITSDGRKLGLDQRIINQALPDEPGTKVNQCVANIMQIWRDGEADKLTQLVFCDISTPQAAPSKKAAKALDNPTLHALEQARCASLDRPADAFASLLRACAGFVPEGSRRRTLELLLYHVGRYLYLTDALEDLPKDLRRNGYNPLRWRYELQDGKLSEADRKALLETIDASIALAASALELLPITQNSELLHNIIYDGLPAVLHSVAAGTFRKRGKTNERPV